MKNIIILGVRSAGIQIADAIIGGASIYREHIISYDGANRNSF